MPKIIHNPKELMNLSREELDEVLLEEYKNTALLRELIRISLTQLKEQTNLTEYYKNKRDRISHNYEILKMQINEFRSNIK